jgi:hypothetical protein
MHPNPCQLLPESAQFLPKSQMMAALFPGLGSVASFSTQVSSTSRKVGAGLAQGVFAPFGFHKTNGFRLAHAPPFVLFPGGGQAGRELQLDQLSADDGIYIHARKVNRPLPFDKPRARKFEIFAVRRPTGIPTSVRSDIFRVWRDSHFIICSKQACYDWIGRSHSATVQAAFRNGFIVFSISLAEDNRA